MSFCFVFVCDAADLFSLLSRGVKESMESVWQFSPAPVRIATSSGFVTRRTPASTSPYPLLSWWLQSPSVCSCFAFPPQFLCTLPLTISLRLALLYNPLRSCLGSCCQLKLCHLLPLLISLEALVWWPLSLNSRLKGQ